MFSYSIECLRLINRFNSLKHLDPHNFNQTKEISSVQLFKTHAKFPNIKSSKNYFEILIQLTIEF